MTVREYHIVPLPPQPVRDVREGLGLDEYDFASYFGVPLSRVRRWESGEEYPPAAFRIMLALMLPHLDDLRGWLGCIHPCEQEDFERLVVDVLSKRRAEERLGWAGMKCRHYFEVICDNLFDERVMVLRAHLGGLVICAREVLWIRGDGPRDDEIIIEIAHVLRREVLRQLGRAVFPYWGTT